MILKSIEIQGFKSFADKTVLQFGKGITAVVGPNGSGKSNISDAVRWVLGEQSVKNLRGQSMEDVIFGGTATRRPHGFAEVTLTIDNSDRALKCDSDTVSVTRRVYRSHESEYLINKAVVRLRDVNELFMDTGLGRDGYSMIGQGKIDSIVSTKSNERRDIFEEASGISRYRYRKTEAERKLAAADDNMLRLKDILSELESRVGPLAEQSKKAEKFIEYARDKKELEIGLWLDSLNRSGDALKAQEQKILIVRGDYDDAEKAANKLANEIDELGREYSASISRIDELRRATAAIEEEIASKRGEIAVFENTISHNLDTTAKLKEDIAEISESDEGVRQQIEERKARIEQKNIQIAELNAEAAKIETELNGLISESEAAGRKIEEYSAKLNEIARLISDAKVASVTAESSIAEIKERLAASGETVKSAKENADKLAEERKEVTAYLDELEATVESCNNSLKGYELRLETRKQRAAEAAEKLQNAKLDIEETRRRINILTDLEKNMDGFDHSVKQVVKQGASGLLKGIIGPVSSVIGVSGEYAVAIETALGNALKNIVVETENDAKRAIEYLKRENAGRATFLPVSSVKGRGLENADGIENLYGFIGVASDLVSCDSKYKEIISSLLGRTVITEDLDSAVTIAKKYNYKFKTVSLDGQVVNPGGAMTGGSHIKNAGILSRAGNIDKLNKQLEELEKGLEALIELDALAKEEVAASDAEILSAKSALATANEDKIRALAELKRIADLEEAAKQSADKLSAEAEALNKRIEELSLSAKENEDKITEFTRELEAVQAEQDGVLGGRDELSQKRVKIAEQLTEKRLKIAEAGKDAESFAESVRMLEYSTRTSSEKAARMREEIEGLSLKNIELETAIQSAQTDIETKQTAIKNYTDEISALLSRRDAFDKDSRELRNAEREQAEKKEKLGGEIARLEERKQAMVKEFDDIVRQLYDEYELTRSEAEAIGIKIENISEAKKTLAEIRSKIKALGSVNVAAIEEYKEVSERYEFMKAQVEDVENSRRELSKLIDELTANMKEQFSIGFAKIGKAFTTTFRELFGGGTAELVLTDPENILESGIDIVAKLPGKNVPSLDGLSGGEKALIAISIYFAIMSVNAPPFCFLDEIDTALDDINVERLAGYMKSRELGTQFICITHRRGTMESADMLYGVTMQEKGITKLLELNVDQLVKTLNLDER
ncbi:MAG: chromosome segregation protein SMC [Clostridia bacterium]|nr:chromosome segregation protein SMC [Clostridia bacterium]